MKRNIVRIAGNARETRVNYLIKPNKDKRPYKKNENHRNNHKYFKSDKCSSVQILLAC